MKASQNSPPHFDDEITLLDIFYFFKLHKKFILILMIIGMIFGGCFAFFYGPVYEGSSLISPPKISGALAVPTKNNIITPNTNSYFSKETFLNCSPSPDNYVDYDMSKIVNASLIHDGTLIKISMRHKNKTLIKNCLNRVTDDVMVFHNKNVSPLIQSKKNELTLQEQKLIAIEEFKNKLSHELFKGGEKNSESVNTITSMVIANMILANNLQNKDTMTEIYKLKTSLSPEQNREAHKIMPITFKKSFPTVTHGALFGLFLGLCLAILIEFIKQIKI